LYAGGSYALIRLEVGEVGDGPSYLSDYYAIRIEICLSFALTTTFLPGKK
jgi:hypothetical protein